MIHTNGNFEKKAQDPPQGLLKGLLNWIVGKIKAHPKISLSTIAVPAALFGIHHIRKGYAQGQAKIEFDPRTILIGSLLGLGGGGLYHMITEDEEENEKSLQKALIAGTLLGTGAGVLLSAFYEGI